MSILFDEDADRAIELLQQGCSLSLASSRGGGRSTVCLRVKEELENTGHRVYFFRGREALRDVPFGAIGSESVKPPDPQYFYQFADKLAQIATDGSQPIVIIDDVHLLDSYSVSLIDEMRTRSQFTSLVAFPTAVSLMRDWKTADRKIVESWASAAIYLKPLPFEEVSELASELLGAPVDAEVTSRLFAMGGGNPLITADLLRTAKWEGLLTKNEGVWVNPSGSLWSTQLHRIAEAYLQELTAPQREALFLIAAAGPLPYSALLDIVGSQRLLELEQTEYIALLSAEQSKDPTVVAVPGLLSEYVRKAASTVTRLRVGAQVATLAPHAHLTTGQAENKRSAAHDAALVEHLQLAGAQTIDRLYHAWEEDPRAEQALAYLADAWANETSLGRMRNVVGSLETASLTDDDALLAAIIEAEVFLYHDENREAAMTVLKQVGEEHPSVRPQADAYRILLDTMVHGVRHDYRQQLEASAQEDGVTASILAFILVIDLRPKAALDVLKSKSLGGDWPQLRVLRIITRVLALLQLGRRSEAEETCAQARYRARRELDRPDVIAAAYASVLVHLSVNDWASVQREIGAVLGAIPGGLATVPLHSALHRFAALASAWGGQHETARALISTLERNPGPEGPLAGQDPSLVAFIEAQLEGGTAVVNRDLAALLLRSGNEHLHRGYVDTAYSAFAASMLSEPTEEALSKIDTICGSRSIRRDEDLWKIARSLIANDWSALAAQIDVLGKTSAHHNVLQLLQAGVQRELAEGRADNANHLKELFETAGQLPSFRQSRGRRGIHDPAPISAREREVALLAGSLSNGDIAERLGISTRTVEKHISNAMHKIAASSRQDLCAKVRRWA